MREVMDEMRARRRSFDLLLSVPFRFCYHGTFLPLLIGEGPPLELQAETRYPLATSSHPVSPVRDKAVQHDSQDQGCGGSILTAAQHIEGVQIQQLVDYIMQVSTPESLI